MSHAIWLNLLLLGMTAYAIVPRVLTATRFQNGAPAKLLFFADRLKRLKSSRKKVLWTADQLHLYLTTPQKLIEAISNGWYQTKSGKNLHCSEIFLLWFTTRYLLRFSRMHGELKSISCLSSLLLLKTNHLRVNSDWRTPNVFILKITFFNGLYVTQ